MTGYTPTHIGIPKNHADFERKAVVLFRELLQDPNVKPLGRSGQSQYGVDLIGYRKGNLKALVGIQCKKKKPNGSLTAAEVRAEVRKALKYKPPLSEFIIVTTAGDDTKLDQLAQELTEAQRVKRRKIRIQVWGWGTLEDHIDQVPAAKEAFDPGASPAVKEVRGRLNEIADSQSKQATAEQVAELSQKIDQRASIGEDQLPPAFADREIVAEISRINRRRGFRESKTTEEFANLATRILEGDLARGSVNLQADGLERSARSHARTETVERAKFFHAEALKRNRQLDASFFDALLPAAEGHPDKTLRALRALGTPEAKGAIFSQMFRANSTKKALEWVQSAKIQITDLDAGGALNLLLQRVENDEFDTALRDAALLDDTWTDTLPALHTVRSSLLLSSILPRDQKRVPFEGLPINPRVLQFTSLESTLETLARARAGFEAAFAATRDLQLTEFPLLLQELILWLKLEDEATREAAGRQIAEEIKDPKHTLRRVRLALAYDIPFNKDALKRRLDAEREIGNWTSDEQFVAFLLAWYSRDDLASLAAFFDAHRTDLYATGQLARGTLLGIEVEALSRVGRFNDARERLAEGRGTVVDDNAAGQMEELVASIEQGNETGRLRKLYESSGELTHLRLLIGSLMNDGNHRELAIYSPILLKDSQRIEDYELSQKALFADGQHQKVLDLAREYPELHKLKDNFLATEGWAYFQLGKVMEARHIARTLVSRRNNSNDRELDISTTIESGDWGYLQAIVTREATRVTTLDAKLLVRLARMAFESGSLYIDRFRDAAIERAPDNPEVLLAAYHLSVERGDEYQETRAHEWFQKAVALSGKDGPVQQVKLKDIVDRSSGWNKKVDDIDAMLSGVRIPLYLAARGLNRQPVEFILGTALRNAKATNANQQFPVLAFSGSRQLFDLTGVRRLALDTSALFTLEFLGLLQRTIDAFDQIVISPNTLSSLFLDRQFIRFRQPSEVAKAREIKKLLANGRLKVLRVVKTEAESAALDIDPDLQILLDKARENRAVVVRSAPVHKLRSFLEEVVDLGRYSDVLTDTHAALDLVRSKVTSSVAENADTYLSQVDKGWKKRPKLTRKSIVYLDQLAVTYLLYVGVLDAFVNSVAEVYVAQEVEGHCDATLRGDELSGDLLNAVERIRATLNAALEKGHVTFSSRRARRDDKEIDQDEDIGPNFPSLDIMSDVSEIDAVVCDDRFLNKEPFWADGSHRAPCVCTLEVLLALNNRGAISEQQKHGFLHKLREGGYYAVPTDVSEFYGEISRATVDGTALVETRELVAIRTSLSVALRSRMHSALETPWVDYTRLVVHQVMQRLWSERSVVTSTVPRADWLLAILPVPIRLLVEPADDVQWAAAVQKMTTQIGLMLSPPTATKQRRREYAEWMEERVAGPTRAFQPSFFDQAIKTLAYFLQTLLERDGKIPADVRKAFVKELVRNLHPNIEKQLFDVDGFPEKLGVKTTQVVTFNGTHSLLVTSFVNALRSAILGKKTATIALADGTKSKVTLTYKAPDTATIAFDNAGFAFTEAGLLNASKPARKRALSRAFASRPLTKSEERRWLKRCDEGPLTDREYTDLVEILRGTPEHFLGLLAAPQPLSTEKLIPTDLSYYARLIGPVQSQSNFQDYIANQQKEHSDMLLKRGYVGLRRLAYSAIYRSLIPFADLERNPLAEIAKLLTAEDPFTLIFGFELCRHRLAKDERAANALGAKFLDRLFGDKKWLQSRLELFSACAVMATVSLRPNANAPAPPLSWYRLAVFAHAGVLTNALRGIRRTHDFFKWSTKEFGGRYLWNTVVDTREEPRWEPDWLDPAALKAELIGRCTNALMLLPIAKQPKAWTKPVEKAAAGLDVKLRAFFPGPLDGFGPMVSPIQAEEAYKEVDSLLKGRSSFKRAPGLSFLAYTGAIDPRLKSEIFRLLEASDEQLAKLKTADQILRCGAYIASINRDDELAKAVIARCARLVSADIRPDAFLRLLLTALRACGAYADMGPYYHEVGIVATRFAYLAQINVALEMRKALDVMTSRDPKLGASFGRAIAILDTSILATSHY